MRICGDELIEGGTTIDDAVEIAQLVEATGHVDYINTSIGVATASLFMIEASMHVPPGYAMFIPSAFRKAVDLPVVGVGRFKDPLQAERALAEGHCDLVGVVRGQIADPDFAAKARAGATDEIRLCLSCNQECVGRMGLNRWLGCIENPRTGREAEVAKVRAAAASSGHSVAEPIRPLDVMVVGAGPAGLQAAISSARHGHRVTVYEQHEEAGGQVRLAASVPNRAEFGDMIRNQLAECRRLGVTIRYGVGVWPGLVDEQRPDHVIVATGAEAQRPWWVPQDAEQVCDVREVLDGSASPFGSVVVIDEIGFHHATSVAELLAERGCDVEVVTPGMVVGQDLGITLDMEGWWMRAGREGHRAVDRSGADGARRARADAAAPPDRNQPGAHAGLGGARRAALPRRVAVPAAPRRRRVGASASATASRRAARTPPWWRASGRAPRSPRSDAPRLGCRDDRCAGGAARRDLPVDR